MPVDEPPAGGGDSVPAAAAPPPPAEARCPRAGAELVMGVLLETAWLDALDVHAKPARAKVLTAYACRRRAWLRRRRRPRRRWRGRHVPELVGEVGY